MTSSVYCAIGDIHGEIERLKRLHRDVLSYARETLPGTAIQFIHLGDLVDRGTDSCRVVEYLTKFEARMTPRPVTLRGNHEQLMIDAVESEDERSVSWRQWLGNGGDATIESYADKPGSVLTRHVAWLKSLPTIYAAPEDGLVFVHAGVDPDRYPDCGDEVRMWTRKREFFDPRQWTAPELRHMRVVHGHTPTPDSRPQLSSGPMGRRLNIDTGAVYGGALTAVVLRLGEPDLFFQT